MSIYTAGHQFYLMLAKESGTITESADGVTPAALPSIPTSPTLLGYIDPADVTRNEGTKQGWGAGSPDAAYTVLGARTFTLNVNVRVGDVALLKEAYENNYEYAVFYGKTNENSDGWANVLRFAKITNVTTNIQANTEEAQEISAQISFECIAWQPDPTMRTVTLSALQSAGGDVLTWHHVIQLLIGSTDYRQGVTGITLTRSTTLQRKPGRADWGEDKPLSRTSYGLQYQKNTITGELTFDRNLEVALFTAAKCATKWDDLTINCDNSNACNDGEKQMNITVAGARPVLHTLNGGDLDSDLTYTVPFVASTITVDTEAAGSGSGSG